MLSLEGRLVNIYTVNSKVTSKVANSLTGRFPWSIEAIAPSTTRSDSYSAPDWAPAPNLHNIETLIKVFS